MWSFSLFSNLWSSRESLWLQMTLRSWLMLSPRPMLVMESWAIKALDWSLTTQNQVRRFSSVFLSHLVFTPVCCRHERAILVFSLNLTVWSLCFQRSSWPVTSSSTRVWEHYASKETLWEWRQPKPLPRHWRAKTCFRCPLSSSFTFIEKYNFSLGFDCLLKLFKMIDLSWLIFQVHYCHNSSLNMQYSVYKT